MERSRDGEACCLLVQPSQNVNGLSSPDIGISHVRVTSEQLQAAARVAQAHAARWSVQAARSNFPARPTEGGPDSLP
jgi:hypothetical protein